VPEPSCNPLKTGQTFSQRWEARIYISRFLLLSFIGTEGEVDSYIPGNDRNLRPRYIVKSIAGSAS